MNQYPFDEKIATPLCEIMGRNKSDKGAVTINKSWHNYTTFYYSIFKDIRYDSLKIFELGVGTNNVNIPCNMGINGRPGASLYGWAEFFENSKIYGADIDKAILFNTDRIKTFYCDQTNKAIVDSMWNEKELEGQFDIIIDDGYHNFYANVSFFENSVNKLVNGGFYIVEDINNQGLSYFRNKIVEWKATYPDLTFALIQIPSTTNSNDNNLMVVKNTRNLR